MERWDGKVAVVTGASSGIGAAIAVKLVEAGMKVVGLARRSDRVELMAKKLASKPGKLYACKTDMRVESDILNAFKWTTANVGPIHILINNAGLATNTNLIDGETAKWKDIFDTNVLGLCIATREAVRIMTANNTAGHIVHINSVAGHKVLYMPGVNVYGASKFAVTNLTTMLRMELGASKSKIKVTSVSPGIVETEFTDNVATVMKDIMTSLPQLRGRDVADAVMFALGTPPSVEISELRIQPHGEGF